MLTRHQPLRIGLLDFEPLRIAGFECVFAEMPDVELMPADIARALDDSSLNMIFLGLQNPVGTFEIMAQIKARQPQLKMIVMGSEADEEAVLNAIAAGAKGYICKPFTADQLKQRIVPLLHAA